MEAPLVNRIAKSKLITIDPGKYYPSNIYSFDLKEFLFQGLILREKDFRLALNEFDWNQLNQKLVFIHCSSDAIIPLWAYMLVSSKAMPHAESIYSGNKMDMISTIIVNKIKESYPTDSIEKREICH